MLALFKSSCSLGKSILTLSDPNNCHENGPDSIFSIAVENDLKTITLVEDSMVGFFDAFRISQSLGIQLIFGLRITCCDQLDNAASTHKLIVFAKNDQGCKDLYSLYSKIYVDFNGRITHEQLQLAWTDNLKLAVPFYDSFIHQNNFYFQSCIQEFGNINPVFFTESNNLPFDEALEKEVLKFTENGKKFEVQKTKSIYYKDKCDVEAFQTYKIICNRTFSRQATLSSPNLNHFGSDEFCWESYLEQTNER